MFGNNDKETAKMFGQTLKGLENAKRQLFSNLSEEQLKGVAKEGVEFTRVMKAVKTGNSEELNKYVSKYANINR
jgi:hypothetical protein